MPVINKKTIEAKKIIRKLRKDAQEKFSSIMPKSKPYDWSKLKNQHGRFWRVEEEIKNNLEPLVTINNIQVNQINPDTIEVTMEFQPTYPMYGVQVNCVVPSQVNLAGDSSQATGHDLDRIGENLGIKTKQR